MLSKIVDCLSIWEIAHRWHGFDPNRTQPEALPLEVQDTLRVITRLMWLHELPSYSAAGVERRTHSTVPNFHQWARERGIDLDAMETDEAPTSVPPQEDTELAPRCPLEAQAPREEEWRPAGAEDDARPLAELNLDELRERYSDQVLAWVRQHDTAIKGFDLVFRHRQYDPEKLDSVYLTRHALRTACIENDWPLPAFWFDETEHRDTRANSCIDEPQKAAALRPNQLDKQLCQAVARTLWDEHPNTTIKAMTEHPAIQRYGNGKLYAPSTVQTWVREVDPRDPDKKVGRPPKAE